MDDRNTLVIVVALAIVSGLGVIGQTILAAMGKPPEPAIIAIAATGVGGLLGFLQQRPVQPPPSQSLQPVKHTPGV